MNRKYRRLFVALILTIELVSKTLCRSEGAEFATEESLIWAVETLR